MNCSVNGIMRREAGFFSQSLNAPFGQGFQLFVGQMSLQTSLLSNLSSDEDRADKYSDPKADKCDRVRGHSCASFRFFATARRLTQMSYSRRKTQTSTAMAARMNNMIAKGPILKNMGVAMSPIKKELAQC